MAVSKLPNHRVMTRLQSATSLPRSTGRQSVTLSPSRSNLSSPLSALSANKLSHTRRTQTPPWPLGQHSSMSHQNLRPSGRRLSPQPYCLSQPPMMNSVVQPNAVGGPSASVVVDAKMRTGHVRTLGR